MKPTNIDEEILMHFKENYEDYRDILNINLEALDIFTVACIEENPILLGVIQEEYPELFNILLETDF